jgi:integrase
VASTGRRGWGKCRKLPSKRIQASYVGPDGRRHTADATFTTKLDAEAWLAAERRLVESGGWSSPAARRAAREAAQLTVADYADRWLAERELKPRTRSEYRRLLDNLILPAVGARTVAAIAPADIRAWHAELDPGTPTQRAHAYALLKAIMATAVDEELRDTNPCRIRGAGSSRRASRTEPATIDELAALVQAMPPRYQAMVLLAAWCALRFGELTELRRSDVDLGQGVLHVRRAVSWVDGQPVVGSPKSEAGLRTVAIPPHIIPAIRTHLQAMPMTGRDALLFPAAGDPSAHLRQSSLNRVFDRARRAVGRPDFRFHDLRHTGAVLATLTGASLKETMVRLGHSTPAAAMRYQHVARGRDQEIAQRLSAMAAGSPDRTA